MLLFFFQSKTNLQSTSKRCVFHGSAQPPCGDREPRWCVQAWWKGSRALESCSACSCVTLGHALHVSGLQCPLSGTRVGGGGLYLTLPSLEVAGKLQGAHGLRGLRNQQGLNVGESAGRS